MLKSFINKWHFNTLWFRRSRSFATSHTGCSPLAGDEESAPGWRRRIGRSLQSDDSAAPPGLSPPAGGQETSQVRTQHRAATQIPGLWWCKRPECHLTAVVCGLLSVLPGDAGGVELLRGRGLCYDDLLVRAHHPAVPGHWDGRQHVVALQGDNRKWMGDAAEPERDCRGRCITSHHQCADVCLPQLLQDAGRLLLHLVLHDDQAQEVHVVLQHIPEKHSHKKLQPQMQERVV